MEKDLGKMLIDLERDLEGLAIIEGDIPGLAKEQAQIVSEIFEMYYQEEVGRKDAIDAILQTHKLYNDAILKFERVKSIDIARQNGFETVTLDTCGVRSAKYLADTKHAFATGVASSGIAVAVIHEDFGMSASHYNAVRASDYRRIIAGTIDIPRNITTLTNPKLFGDLVNLDGLTDTTRRAANFALGKFATLSPSGGLPAEGTMVCLIGLSFLNDRQIPIILETVQAEIVDFQQKHDITQSEGKIGIGNYLGNLGEPHEPQGIIYGGKTHLKYPEPSLYALR